MTDAFEQEVVLQLNKIAIELCDLNNSIKVIAALLEKQDKEVTILAGGSGG